VRMRPWSVGASETGCWSVSARSAFVCPAGIFEDAYAEVAPRKLVEAAFGPISPE